MANSHGANRTGFDGELYEIGTRLQNVGSVKSLREIAWDLQVIVEKVDRAQAKKIVQQMKKEANA